MKDKLNEKVSRIFRGMSPRAQRPTFGDGWEGTCPGPAKGWGIVHKDGNVAYLVEGYKLTVSASKIWPAHQGFVAVVPAGETVRWTDRFGRGYIADFDGIREEVETI